MGSALKNMIHISELDKAFTSGKVAEILDQNKF
jgi:hypothetical protein